MNNSFKDFFENENDRNDFYIAIPVIALATIFIIWQWGKSDISVVDNTQVETVVATIPAISQNNDIVSLPNEVETIEKQTISNIAQNNSAAPVVSSIQSQTVEQDDSTITPVETVEEAPITESIPQPSVANTPEADIVQEVISETPKGAVVESKEAETPVIQDSADEGVQQGSLDCSIAVGLYKKQKNLSMMFNSLVQSGHPAVKVPLRNSTKIAIKIPCDKKSSLRILREIRAEFASDAFIE